MLEQAKVKLFADMFVESWWKRNQRRVEEWVGEEVELGNGAPDYDDFDQDFYFEEDESITIGWMIEEHMSFMDLNHVGTTGQIVKGFKARFEGIVDDVVTEVEQQEREAEWDRYDMERDYFLSRI